MQQSVADMTIRLENAFLRGVDTISTLADISPVSAAKVARVYIHVGLARLDPVDGQFRVRHGAVYDAAMIERAAGEAGDELLAMKATPWRPRR